MCMLSVILILIKYKEKPDQIKRKEAKKNNNNKFIVDWMKTTNKRKKKNNFGEHLLNVC